MRTERLFYKDSHQTTCQAKVLACREVKKGYEILLDQTVFYPEGGGQPCDIGTMNRVEVMDVQEKDGEIWHRTREAIQEGTEVTCRIDWEHRFDLMQQHSGEHLISGLIHEKYGYNNVGFHMGSETITLDVDGEVPEEVLKEVADEMMDYNGTGMSVMEMSHRSAAFQEIIDTAEKDLRELMNIPDNYKVLFLQGGASQQFAMIPMNLMKNKVADYIVTGQWAKKAYQEAQKYGKANKIASSEDKTFSYIPDCSDLPISPDADYVYICENNTIYGTKFKKLPNTKGKTLVADVSSCFLSEPVDVSKYGIIYGGVQKNIGPAGMVIVIIREDLITEDVLPGTPTMLTYKTHADAGSLYNTPNAYCIYVCGKVFKWLKKLGGLEVMKQRNEEKAKILYDYLDSSKLFKGTVVPEDRSLMNVPFVTGDKEMDAKFVKEATEAGLVNLKGHRTVGGMRASIYNAMPKAGVEALVAFMKKFEEENA